MLSDPTISREGPTHHRRVGLATWLVTVCVSLASLPVQAQPSADPHAGHHAPTPASPDVASASAPAPAPAGLPEVAAEVRRIQADQGKVTLRHAPIPNLDMAAMTMVFRVADPSWLFALQPNDRVLITVDQGPQGLTVRSLRLQP
jgi:Cu(I)/Ag(I) efflux system periplasmic protein CusF